MRRGRRIRVSLRPAGRPGKIEEKQALGVPRGHTRRVAFGQLDLEKHQTVNPDVAVIEMTAPGRLKDTSEPYEMSSGVVLTVRDGLIKRYRDYWNPLSAVHAPAGS